MTQSARRTADHSTLSHSSAATPSELSEDVTSLLHRGKHILQQEREQRRQSSRITPSSASTTGKRSAVGSLNHNSHNYMATSTRRSAHANTSSAPSSTLSFLSCAEATHHTDHMSPREVSLSSSSSLVLTPSLYTEQSIQQLRAHLEQLKELDAVNTRTFEQRWLLLQRGRERLERAHDPVAAERREHYVAALMSTAQAVVEGGDIVCDTLRETADHLRRFQRQQEQTGPPNNETSPIPSEAANTDGETMTSGGVEDEGKEELLDLVRVIRQHTQRIIRTYSKRLEMRAAEERRAQTALQQHAESVEQQKQHLKELQNKIQQLSEWEKQKQADVEDIKVKLAARAQAVALQKAAASRRQAVYEGLQRLAQLQEEAMVNNAIARQELAASEARYKEIQATYDMALREHESVEDEVRVARRRQRKAQQRRQEVEADLEALRDDLTVVDQQCAVLRAQRLAFEEDLEALQDATRAQQQQRERRRHDTKYAAASFVSTLTGSSRVVDDVHNSEEDRFAVVQSELLDLKDQLRTYEDKRTALLKENEELQECLVRERAAVSALQARKAALEAYLVAARPPGLK